MRLQELFGLFTIALLLFSGLAYTQSSELKLIGKPERVESEIVAKRDASGYFCAAIQIISNMDGFSYESNNGVVDVDDKPGMDIVYLQASERVLEIYQTGFKPLRIILSEVGISLREKEVWKIELGGDTTIEELYRLTFRINEPDIFIKRGNYAPVQVRGTSAVFEMLKGKHDFQFLKAGFQDQIQTIDLEEDKTIQITMESGQSESTLKLPAIVTITSDPNGAEVYINGQKMGMTPFQDELIAGEHEITLQKKFYQPFSETIIVDEGVTKDVPIITLRSKFVFLEINTVPPADYLYLNGKEVGTAEMPRTQLESGNYSVRAEKGLYYTTEQVVELKDGDDQKLSLELQPAFGELVISTEPGEADLYINDVKVGKTPFQNRQQASGEYTIRVEKDLWMPEEIDVTISDAEKTRRNIVLSKNFGTLNIQSDGADLYLNQEKAGTSRYRADLQPGNYTVKAVKAKHYDDQKEIYLKIGDEQTITLEPKPRLAKLSIISEPIETKDAEIYLNDELQKQVTPAVMALLIGDYRVALKKTGYLETLDKVSLAEGDSKTLRISMQTYAGSRLQKRKTWSRRKWLNFAAGVVWLGAGYYCNTLGDQYYRDYQDARTNSRAEATWNNTEAFFNYRDISYSISIAPFIFGVYSWIKEVSFMD